MGMALFLREEDIGRLLTMDICLQAVEEVTRLQGEGRAINVPRINLRSDHARLALMAAVVPPLGVMGFKAYSWSAEGLRFLVHLYDAQSGRLLSVMEADKLGQMRTGAASGVATNYLARPNASVLGIYGSGWQARSQVMAIAAVRPLRLVKAYSPHRERLHAFCREMAEALGLEVRPLDEPREVASGSDIVVTATNSPTPVLRGEWLAEGVHINAIGSGFPDQRELDEAAVRGASLIVVDCKEQAKYESGDLLPLINAGSLTWDDLHELADIIVSKIPSRQSEGEITLFKSHGIALWDIATAARVHVLARERGLGEEVPLFQ